MVARQAKLIEQRKQRDERAARMVLEAVMLYIERRKQTFFLVGSNNSGIFGGLSSFNLVSDPTVPLVLVITLFF